MGNINCRNVRREIEEATSTDLLGAGVNNHLLRCDACKALLQEESKLRALVSSLGTVEAPGDFDFRLRARLAAEKGRAAKSFPLGSFFLGFRSVAAVTMLLLVGSALMFVSFRTRLGNPASSGVAAVATKEGISSPGNPGSTVDTGRPDATASTGNQAVAVDAGVNVRPSVTRRTAVKQTLASMRENNRARSRDLSSTPADVLRRDQLAEAYQTAFPIDAGYQSLKVSVDDGRGTSRTISLPTVSFGSQRSLSQGGSPLMASARGSW